MLLCQGCRVSTCHGLAIRLCGVRRAHRKRRRSAGAVSNIKALCLPGWRTLYRVYNEILEDAGTVWHRHPGIEYVFFDACNSLRCSAAGTRAALLPCGTVPHAGRRPGQSYAAIRRESGNRGLAKAGELQVLGDSDFTGQLATKRSQPVRSPPPFEASGTEFAHWLQSLPRNTQLTPRHT